MLWNVTGLRNGLLKNENIPTANVNKFLTWKKTNSKNPGPLDQNHPQLYHSSYDLLTGRMDIHMIFKNLI